MSILLTAIASMTIVTLAVHMGLTDAIVKVISKIASCSQCATFWCTLIALTMFCDGGVIVDVMVSIIVAYVSNYFALLLIYLQKKYEKLWQKIKKLR